MTEEIKTDNLQLANSALSEELFSKLLELGYPENEIKHVVHNLGITDYELAAEMLINSSYINNQNQSCTICQTTTNDNYINLIDCSDIFCKNCLKNYVTIRIEEGQVLTMPCPNHDCKGQIEERIIKLLISENLFEKYQKFKNNEELSKNPYLRWCPKPDCTGSDVGSIEKQQLTCDACKFEFCYYCQEAWHGNSKCKFEADKQMDVWAKRFGIKICPNCRRKVEKLMGCDHMTCTKCRYEWCWLCGEKYSGSHYENCEVRLLLKRDPKLETVLILLLLPLAVPFICIILCCKLVYKEISRDYLDSFAVRHKYFTYFLAVIVGIIISPLFFVIAPFATTIVYCCQRVYNIIPNEYLGITIGILSGIISAPFFAILVVFGSIIAHFCGLLLIIKKLYIFGRRCKDPLYLKPKSNYRF